MRKDKLRYLDLAVGWTFVVVGSFHNFVGAPILHPTLNSATLWFISGGIAMWLIGALNLLRVGYGQIAPGLRQVCFLANLVMTAFSVTYAAVTRAWRTPRGVLLLAVCVGATLFSLHGIYPAAPRNVSLILRKEG